jgi:hypothetical protein
MSSTSRNAYTAITECVAFPIPHTSTPSGLNSPSSSRRPDDHRLLRASVETKRRVPSRIHSCLASAKDVVRSNIGLLLVIASQAFFTLTNVAVKILDNIDPPISTLEVCWFSILSFYS